MKTIFVSIALLFATPGIMEFDNNTSETYVFICTGKSSKRYHNTMSCRGLQSCRGDILKVTKEKAIEMGRTPCKMCY